MTRRFMDRAIVVMVALALLAMALGIGLYVHMLTEVSRLRSQVAAMNSSHSITQMAINDMQDVARNDDQNIDQACAFSSVLRRGSFYQTLPDDQKTAFLNAVWNICPDTPGSHIKEQREFLHIYLPAVTARIRQDFKVASDGYGKALTVSGISEVQPDWRVRALEGRGYSLMRIGDLASAKSDLDQALALSRALPGGYIFANLSDIKLKCKQRAGTAAIQSELKATRDDFDRLKASFKDGDDRKVYADLDRRSIEQDDELFEMCRYAKISPEPIS